MARQVRHESAAGGETGPGGGGHAGRRGRTVRIAKRSALLDYAWLSIAAAGGTMAIKAVAYRLTGSIGLLSDALESLVNLAGAVVALSMLAVAARPPDEGHRYGHGKAEYFSSFLEGILILVAAAGITVTAIERLQS